MKRFLLISCCALLAGGCALTPEPFSEAELADLAIDRKSRLTADQEALHGALTLDDAMARALKYNLDKEVEVMSTLLAQQQLRVAHYSLLPNVVANSGYADRDNYAGGSSVKLISPTGIGEQSLTSSTSSERDVRTSDIRFSWHVLDFGLSWIRAKQAGDKVLIAEEARRRVVNRMLENVRAAYWRAVAATRLLWRLDRLEVRVGQALADTKSLIAKGESSPLTALTYERELVEIQREARKLAGELASAKAQLAALVNLDPGKPFTVAIPSKLVPPGHVALSPESLIDLALTHRSELREVAYHQRINAREAEAALLEMLPGLSLSSGSLWDSNRFLYNSHWISWGAQASWNLVKVFSYPERRAEVETKDALLDKRALAVTMAIMTQVHVARARLFHARREFETARHFHDVQSRVLEQMRSALDAGKVSEQTAIREELNTLVATVKRDMAFADLQSAAAALAASVGRTPTDRYDFRSMPLAEIRQTLTTGSIAHRR